MRIRAVTGPIVLAALLATTPQLAVGQPDDDESVEITCRGCRPGTEIESGQLVEFLAKNLNVSFVKAAGAENWIVSMRLETISREEEVKWTYESKPVEVEAGESYDGSTWLRAAGEIDAPGFGDRRKVTLERFVVINHEEQYVPRECESATHAVRITLAPDLVGGRSIQGFGMGLWFVCLNVEG